MEFHYLHKAADPQLLSSKGHPMQNYIPSNCIAAYFHTFLSHSLSHGGLHEYKERSYNYAVTDYGCSKVTKIPW